MQNSEEDSESKSQYSEGSALFDPDKQARVRDRVRKLREKNQANQRIRTFRNLLQKKESGTQVSLSHQKMQALPAEL